MIILQNLITTNHRKNGKSKDDLKLTELDVVTMRVYANPVPCKRGLTVIYYIFKLQFRITEDFCPLEAIHYFNLLFNVLCFIGIY